MTALNRLVTGGPEHLYSQNEIQGLAYHVFDARAFRQRLEYGNQVTLGLLKALGALAESLAGYTKCSEAFRVMLEHATLPNDSV
jgi:hypothetical protein